MTHTRVLWTLARVRLLVFVLLLVGLGAGVGHWDRALGPQKPAALGMTVVAWSLLHVGTMWLNATLDRDDGPVLLGESVPPPAWLGGVAQGLLLCVPCVGFAVNREVGQLAVVASGLSWLYSHPMTAWKGHPLLGPLVNVLGYGVVSPLAGFYALGLPITWRVLAIVPVVGSGVLAVFFAAQAFQENEDRARGYQTFVAMFGGRETIDAARIMLTASGLWLMGLVTLGWLPLELCSVLLPMWWTEQGLRGWKAQNEIAYGGMMVFTRRLVMTVLVGVIAVGQAHLDAMAAGGPVAGLATQAGHPPDRPRLSPASLFLWEVHHRRQVAGHAETRQDSQEARVEDTP